MMDALWFSDHWLRLIEQVEEGYRSLFAIIQIFLLQRLCGLRGISRRQRGFPKAHSADRKDNWNNKTAGNRSVENSLFWS
jgi:hypothetical protein